MAQGFASEGFEVILGADLNPVALATFSRNFPGARALQVDLGRCDPFAMLHQLGLEPGELDCLVGGPPCQGFSKNVPASKRCADDPRNLLVLRFLDFIRVFQPKVVLMENVAEMMNAYQETYTQEVLAALGDMGYEAKSGRVSAVDYGVPQYRRRAFFFANRLGVPVEFPEPTHVPPGHAPLLVEAGIVREYVTVWEAIGDLPSLEAGEGESPCSYLREPVSYYQEMMREGAHFLYDHVARRLAGPQLERVRHLAPGEGEGVEALPDHLRPRMGYSGAYARLSPYEPARTITRWVFHPGSGRYYHPYDNRVITIREAARLQSFPDTFVFEGTYIQKAHQVGEAVPPLLARAFAREVKRALLNEPKAPRGERGFLDAPIPDQNGTLPLGFRKPGRVAFDRGTI